MSLLTRLALCVSFCLIVLIVSSELSSPPPILWTSGELASDVYEVILRGSPVGYQEVNKLSARHWRLRRHIRLVRGGRVVEQQLELELSLLPTLHTVSDQRDIQWNIRWRQLTQDRPTLVSPLIDERLSWLRWLWISPNGPFFEPAQLSSGAALITAPVRDDSNQDISHQVAHDRPDESSQARSCLWASAVESALVSHLDHLRTLSKRDERDHERDVELSRRYREREPVWCAEAQLVPQQLWPWIHVQQRSQSTKSGLEANQLALFDLVSGDHTSGVVSQRDSGQRRSSERSLETTHRELSWTEQGEHEPRSIQAKLNDDEVIIVKSKRGALTWTYRRVERSSLDDHARGAMTALSGFESISVAGSADWRNARAVTLEVSSPLKPLVSARQDVTPIAHHSQPISSDQEQIFEPKMRGKVRVKIRRQAPLKRFCVSFSQRPAMITLPPTSTLNQAEITPNLFELRAHLQRHNQVDRLTESTGEVELPLELILRESTAWVAERIKFKPHAGFSDPRLALERGVGDCTEKSAALVLILNSLGIRAEQVFGLLWLGGSRWGLHAWTRVETPQGWVELDPSMNTERTQTRIGPEHLAFTTGDHRAQSALSLLWGRWRARVIK